MGRRRGLGEWVVRLAVDARAAEGAPGGITSYVLGIVCALEATSGGHQVLLLRGTASAAPLSGDPRFQEVPVAGAGELWAEMNLDSVLSDWGADVFHSPLAPPPVVCPCASVMTAHDLIPRVLPELVDTSFRSYFRDRVEPGLRRCDLVIAVSDHTGRDLAHLCGLDGTRVAVVPPAALPEHTTTLDQSDMAVALAELSVRRPYFLYVGAVEPRKNISGLLDAFAALSQQSGDTHLVVAGAARDQSAAVARRLREATQHGAAIWIERASSRQLCALYQGALAFVFPSLYEGFGLPVLEAMSHGLPVITSRVSALPEVVGEAGMLVDPYDAEALTGAMARVFDSEERRRWMAARSQARAEEFTMEKTGEGLMRAYGRARDRWNGQ
jgi:glycosyltransferase involved in cell wall biosynthesis